MNGRNELTRRDFLNRLTAGGALALGLSTKGFAEAGSESSDTADNSPWQIGCYTRPFGSLEYPAALDAIAEAGYRHVGLMSTQIDGRGGLVITYQTTLDEALAVGEACKSRGLSVPSAYGGGIPVVESLDAGITGMRSLIDNCEAAGVADLLMGGVGDPELQGPYYKAVAETCDYAAEKGVSISVKPHGGLNATGAQCRDIVNEVNHENFRVWYDPGNIFYYSDAELDPVDDAADVDGLVVGMCVKDYEHPRKVDVTPGTGMVDFPAVMKRLIQGGFTGGALVVETLAPGDVKETIQEAIKAREFLEALVADL